MKINADSMTISFENEIQKFGKFYNTNHPHQLQAANGLAKQTYEEPSLVFEGVW